VNKIHTKQSISEMGLTKSATKKPATELSSMSLDEAPSKPSHSDLDVSSKSLPSIAVSPQLSASEKEEELSKRIKKLRTKVEARAITSQFDLLKPH
jgi:hypothetical protein